MPPSWGLQCRRPGRSAGVCPCGILTPSMSCQPIASCGHCASLTNSLTVTFLQVSQCNELISWKVRPQYVCFAAFSLVLSMTCTIAQFCTQNLSEMTACNFCRCSGSRLGPGTWSSRCWQLSWCRHRARAVSLQRSSILLSASSICACLTW